MSIGGAAAGPVGAAIGAFVGFIIGDLFGSLFGHHRPRTPTASAETVLQIPFARYAIGTETSANGGDLQLADSMAAAARDTLNGLIAQITRSAPGALVANLTSPTQTYGLTGSQIYVKLNGVENDVASANQAVDIGVLSALPATHIIGGDIILKRAINGTKADITTLLGDLQTAADYETYLKARPLIDAAIGASWNSLSAGDQAFYTANHGFITRALAKSQVALSPSDQAFYNANQTQVDRITAATQVSGFAAGWIVTLAHAAELNLDQFASSDFYGGFKGFLQSFGVAATGSVEHFEDITITARADGSASIGAKGAAASGVFSLVPGNLDGSPGNDVYNPRFQQGLSGWSQQTNVGGVEGGVNLPGWSGSGNDVIWSVMHGMPNNAYVDWYSDATPSIAGHMYEASADAAAHRSTAQLWVQFLDANMNNLGYQCLGSGGRAYGSWQGDTSTYDLLAGSAIAPPGTAFRKIMLRNYSSGTSEPYAFFTRPESHDVTTATDLSNPRFLNGQQNWALASYSAAGTQWGDNLDANWSGHGNDVLWLHMPGQTGQNDVADIRSERLGATAGSIYEVSILAAQHRGRVEVQVEWFDGNGNWISSSAVAGAARDSGAYQGDPANFNTIAGTVTAPTGAVYRDLLLRNWGAGGVDPYAFFTQPIFRPAGAGSIDTWSTMGADYQAGGAANWNAVGETARIANFASTVGYNTNGYVSSGNDLIDRSGATSNVSIDGSVWWANGGDDIFIGGSGNDALTAGSGNVWVDGGAGNDLITGGAGRDVLLGGAGDDTINAGSGDTYLAGGDGNDALNGGAGNDIFVGGAGSNHETGGAGNDTFIYGTSEADTIDGGSGSNTLSFERRTAAVSFGLTGGAQGLDGGSIVNVENITGSAYNDTLNDGPVGGTLKGLAGNDNLQGGAGNDVLEGGPGADIIAGNGGINTASYASSSSGVYVNLATGAAIGGDATGDVLSNIQNLTGSANNDELAGDANANVISAGAGDDWIDATAGADTYDGGDGFDTVDYSQTAFTAGTATYTYNGSQYTYTAPAVSVTLGNGGGYATYRNADGSTGSQTLTSIEQIIGTSSNDTFSSAGSAIDVTWDGAGGNDTFSGGSGNDTYLFGIGYGVSTISDSNSGSNTIKLKPGATFDSLWVSNPSGVLQIGDRGGAGHIDVSADYATSGNDVVKTLDMAGAAQVDLTLINAVNGGTISADSIVGSSTTNNLVFGYDGNDTIASNGYGISTSSSVIDGGLGNDSIYAGSGDDQFLFERGDGHDTISDSGGRNTIIFGPTVGANDVIYQVVGYDLYVGVKDPNNPTYAASQVADYMLISNGGFIRENSDTGKDDARTLFSVEAGGVTTDLSKANIGWTYVYYTNSGGGGGGGGGHGGPLPPIVLDLNGDGLQLSPVAKSDIVTRDSSGKVLRTSWVGPTNGILAYDRNGDGKINNTDDISFVQDKAGATTDLQGLAGWDTNGDGILDATDTNFGKLVVWVDSNQDGRAEKGEVKSLAQLGIASIALAPVPTGYDDSDTQDSFVRNTTTFARTDGTSGTAYDVALARQTLAGNPAQDVSGSVDLGATATFGQLKNDPLKSAIAAGLSGAELTVASISSFANVDLSDSGSISAADAALWADYLDPTKAKARKDKVAQGGSGAEFLDTIRTTIAGAAQTNGIRDPKTRLQAIVIDFNQNGPDLIQAGKSHALVDATRSGRPAEIGWVKGSDGILAYDRNGDGLVDPATEVSFLGDVAGAKTSMEGLGAFDTNHDGVINALDASFAKFLVWRDVNGNGTSDAGEVQSLSQAGVKEIQLSGAKLNPNHGVGSGNDVMGVSKITFTDGSTRAIYDVALGYADSKDGGAAPPANPVTPASAPIPDGSAGSSAGGTTAAPATANAPAAAIGLARGSDGPGTTIVAASTTAADSEWWRNADVVGQSLAALVTAFAADDTSLGSNRTSIASAAMTDAATLQRVMLLRQNMASLQPATGGSAAIWNRGAANDQATLAASPLPVVTPLKTGTGG